MDGQEYGWPFAAGTGAALGPSFAATVSDLSQLTGAEPAELRRSYLAVPDRSRPVFAGTATVALVPAWRPHQSGLLLPGSAQTPLPIDLIQVYLTAEDIYGSPLPPEYTVEQLRQCTVAEVLRFCSLVLNAANRPNASRRQVDEACARWWFREPARTRVLNLLRDPRRTLVVPQALMLLARAATEHSPRTLPDSEPRGNLAAALIALTDHMGANYTGQTVVHDEPGPLGREVIANQHFHRTPSPTNLIARYARRWRQLPDELARDPKVTDLAQAYQDATGVSLDDLTAIGALLWLAGGAGMPLVPLHLIYGLQIPNTTIDQVLDLISTDLDTFRAAVRSEAAQKRTEWSFDPFQRWPVLRLDPEHLLILDARYVVNRTFGWLPIFDIKFPPQQRLSKSAHKKLVHAAEQSLRHVTEVYVNEVLCHIAGDKGVQRVYDDADLQTAFRRDGQRIADAVIDYGDTWIVVEVTTTRLRREAETAVPDDSQVQDIDKLINELDQIDATINALRAGEEKLTGAEPLPHRRFVPLLVLPEGFPVNPVTLSVIRQRAHDRGILTEDDIAPIEIVDIEELEIVEALQEVNGPSLLDILRRKQASSLSNVSLRDYLIHGAGLQVGGPRRLSAAFMAALEPLLRARPQPVEQ